MAWRWRGMGVDRVTERWPGLCGLPHPAPHRHLSRGSAVRPRRRPACAPHPEVITAILLEAKSVFAARAVSLLLSPISGLHMEQPSPAASLLPGARCHAARHGELHQVRETLLANLSLLSSLQLQSLWITPDAAVSSPRPLTAPRLSRPAVPSANDSRLLIKTPAASHVS